MKNRFSHTIVLLIIAASITCCNKPEKRRFVIVATTNIIGDAIKEIVKDNASVEVLMGAGVDPHSYKATQGDMDKLTSADVVFYNGLHLEGKMADIFHKMSLHKHFYAVSDGLDKTDVLHDPKFEAAGADPHIWFDVSLWKKVVDYISKKLQELDPKEADYYKKNNDIYLHRLSTLHETIKQLLKNIPKEQRVLISAHDAFNYFGKIYEVEVKGLQGISTVSECGLKDITDLVKFIIKRNIKALFLETSVPEGPMQAVVEGCKRQGYIVIVGGHLYSDSLGQESLPEGTYCGMMLKNAITIANSLNFGMEVINFDEIFRTFNEMTHATNR